MYFCTLFDSYYINKGIALYLSLEKVTSDFHLYVMAFDKDCYEKLQSCGFKHMTVESSEDFETPELLAVKPSRTKAEYCWTCGPSVVYHFLTKYKLPEITYLDSDLFFLSDPHIIKEESEGSSIVISRQGVGEQKSLRYGKYCVQYVTFKNDKDGVGALTWWKDRCIEWCFSRYEDGKYGDQKYLDQFEVLFNNVHVVQNRGFIGPWDVPYYEFTDRTLKYKGEEYPFVFFHMSGMRFELEDKVLTLNVVESEATSILSKLFYTHYVEMMRDIYNNYLGKEVVDVKVKGGNKIYLAYKRFRGHFSNNRLAQFLYYKLLNKRYKGHGDKKVI